MMKVALVVLVVAGAASARLAGKLAGGFRISPGFSCEGRDYGYYADVENNCQLFHVCFPVTDEIGALIETAHFTFACNNLTIFDQQSLTCNFADQAFPCDQATTLYELSNADFFRIPEENILSFPEEGETSV